MAAYLFILPAVLLVATFEYAPTLSAFYYSFTEYHLLIPEKWIGFDNYKELYQDSVFWKALRNSLMYFLIIVPLLISLPLLLALLVNLKMRGIYLFRVLYYLPVITSMVAIAIVFKYLYHPVGLINAFLDLFGLKQYELNWLLDSRTALPSVALLEVWKAMGLYMIIYLSALQSLSQELVEAAKIDGAKKLRILWHIYLPHLRPIFAVTLTLASLASIQIFTSVYVMTGGGPQNETLSLPMQIYNEAFIRLNMGYASAMGIVLFALMMVLTMINFKISRGGRGV
ncbi:carbohydrate ABC transporter permease [Paenibacillus nasutitermitis]|uniref:Sugar ABC transporter permease n=1 Tax=Paenibacillus nasutitermitis TaxID=1652958 RepID=A0A917DY14_9BACL|nr:sugar ABC transporter permease [Paenibacillus nasutitermitis]GGD78398.1 sugar ABC transporter permease [Paenibacillus nasutitermitis]